MYTYTYTYIYIHTHTLICMCICERGGEGKRKISKVMCMHFFHTDLRTTYSPDSICNLHPCIGHHWILWSKFHPAVCICLLAWCSFFSVDTISLWANGLRRNVQYTIMYYIKRLYMHVHLETHRASTQTHTHA